MGRQDESNPRKGAGKKAARVRDLVGRFDAKTSEVGAGVSERVPSQPPPEAAQGLDLDSNTGKNTRVNNCRLAGVKAPQDRVQHPEAQRYFDLRKHKVAHGRYCLTRIQRASAEDTNPTPGGATITS